VVFIDDEGKTDSAAWELLNIDDWMARIYQIKSF
jgi:hypothetical protein